MRKNLLVVSLVALFVSFASASFAEVGVQFRVPYQGTASDSSVKSGASGSSVLITFDIDAGTTVGILTEQINYTEKVGAADIANRYNVNAIRVTKAISEPVYVGIGLGSANFAAAGAGTAQQAPLADIVGGVKLLSSKGKITSFLNLELAYRLLRTAATPSSAAGVTDFGGTFVSLGAGVNF